MTSDHEHSPMHDRIERFLDWTKERSTFLAIAAGIVVLFGVGMGVWYVQCEKNEQAAQSALLEVEGELSGPTEARKEDEVKNLRGKLEEIIQKFEGTRAAKSATLHLADLLYHAGLYAEAEKQYKAHLKVMRRRSRYRAVVLNSLGYALEEQGKFKEAAETFVKAANTKKNAVAGFAHFNAARSFEKAGDKATAAEHYQACIDANPNKKLVSLSRYRLKFLQ